MIPRRGLQLLLSVLCIFYVVGEDDLIYLEGREDLDNATNNISDYTEYTTETNDLYQSESTESTFASLNETTEFNQNELTTDIYSNDNDVEQSSFNVSIDDLIQESELLFGLMNEMDNELLDEESEIQLSTCDIEETEDVQNLTIHSVGTTWICLSWFPPCANTINESFIYSIEICDNGKCSQVNETSTEHNATKLDPCTAYAFNVKAINDSWESNGVNISATTSYNITKVGEVQELRVDRTTMDTIQIIWKSPILYPTCVHNYSVTQCFKDDCEEFTVTSREYVAEKLEPCKEYLFTVVAVTETIQSLGANISAKIKSPKLDKPRFPVAEADSFSLYVHWEPPENAQFCIKYYRVNVSAHPDRSVQSLDTNVTINDLHACTSYDIHINAVDEENRDGEIVLVQNSTVPTVSERPILHYSEPSVTQDSIHLTWKIEKKNNNCHLVSLMSICNHTESDGHGYELVDGESVTRIDAHITDEFLIVNSTIKYISPYTTYKCHAYTVNKAGMSKLSDVVRLTTSEDVPSAPILDIRDITDSDFVFLWGTPKYLPGSLQTFEIVLVWETLFPIPDWCGESSSTNIMYFNSSVFIYEYLEATAFASYTAKIRAKTNAGWGNYSEPLLFQTKPGVPGIVSNFSYLIKESRNDTNVLDTILMWALPCSLNGMIEYFNVSVHGTRQDYAPHSFSLEKYISGSINKNEMFIINLRELKGEYNYTIKVSAKVARVNEFGIEASYSNILYPAGIPPHPDEEYIRSITIDPYKARRSTTSAAILLPLFPDTNGDIIYYSIMISELGYNPASNTRFELRKNTWPNESSWEEAMLRDFTIPYQATRPYWDPYPNYVADYGHMKAVKYVLGEDTPCKEISSNTEKRLYCNGPLKPDTWYHVRMRAFTNGGYTDSTVFVVKTNAEINVGIVIGIVFGILFLGILTTMMLLVRKCSPHVVLRRFLHSDMPGSPVPAPFTRKKFVAHCQQLVDNPGKLSNEFRLLQTLSVDLQMPTNTACLQANRKKNRYSDILPYDFSRVKLEVIDNDPNTDYINASFIRGYTGEDEYIACQGPKEETTYDFWRMVDQYNVNIIIMLTQLVEKGKEKCHQYFPAIKETFRYENMTIRCTSELDYRTYTQRMLVLQKGNKKRNIIHLHFKDWPDHDVPEDFDPMIHFCQIMRRNILANKGLVIIHCSAGIGRTGTLIAIDILLQHLRDNRKLDVFGTVYRLRHHRINMVQRESQYAYIYNCIKQVLKNPYCLKTYKPPPVDPVCDNISKKGRTASCSNTNLVNNFETLKKRNFFVSMDSIRPLYDIFSWPSRKPQTGTINNGLRYCKSTSAIDRKSHHYSLGESDSFDCLIYEALQNTAKEPNRDDLNKDVIEHSTNFMYEDLSK